jgi:tetratricopeptide (TPR) repeat protein
MQSGRLAALPFYLHAIELDPQFAMARRAAGLAYAYDGQRERAREYQKQAFDLRQRAPATANA